MNTPRHTYRHRIYGRILGVLLCIALLGIRGQNIAPISTVATSHAIEHTTGTSYIDLAGYIQPFILQPTQPLTLNVAEVRTPHTTPAGLQQCHIHQYRSTYQILRFGRAVQQTLLYTRGHYLNRLCRMII